MNAPGRCYLVEWYRSEATGDSLGGTADRIRECAADSSAHGSNVRLLNMFAVPADEVLFGLFSADSATVVRETCDRAGLPAQRVAPVTDLYSGRSRRTGAGS